MHITSATAKAAISRNLFDVYHCLVSCCCWCPLSLLLPITASFCCSPQFSCSLLPLFGRVCVCVCRCTHAATHENFITFCIGSFDTKWIIRFYTVFCSLAVVWRCFFSFSTFFSRRGFLFAIVAVVVFFGFLYYVLVISSNLQTNILFHFNFILRRTHSRMQENWIIPGNDFAHNTNSHTCIHFRCTHSLSKLLTFMHLQRMKNCCCASTMHNENKTEQQQKKQQTAYIFYSKEPSIFIFRNS